MADITGEIIAPSTNARLRTPSIVAHLNGGGTVEVPLEWVVISTTPPALSSDAIIWVNPEDTTYYMYIKVNNAWEGVPGFTGEDGTDGTDGVSPIVTVTETTDEYTITITDATHTETMQIKKEGGQGPQGPAGFSPIATVSKSGSVATISITDENGTTTATVSDGTDGEDGYTPVRGTDYWTTADQTVIVDAVLAALPAAESVSV